MARIIVLFIPFVLIAFWIWMFTDMLHNDDLPGTAQPSLKWPPDAKNQWMVFFVIATIFTAGFYYFTVYSERD